CVVKPYHEGSSLGVSVVYEPQLLYSAMVNASTVSLKIRPQPVIIEEYIEGMEFACIVLTDSNQSFFALPPTEVVLEQNSKFCDYVQKYMPGRGIKHTPARCEPEQIALIQDTCIKTARALGMSNFARIDGFLTLENEVIITDPNSFTGMAPSSFIFNQAAEINMSPTQLINHLIATELRQYGIEHSMQVNSEDMERDKKTKIRVGVLFGGDSNEREISLESGRNVLYKLSPEKYDAIPLFVSSSFDVYHIDHKLCVRNTTQEIEKSLGKQQKIPWTHLGSMVDFVFISLHGGRGENGSVQGLLEMLSIPYNGSSVLTSALCMDKHRTNAYLKSLSFEVPEGVLLSLEDWQANSYREKLKNLGSYPIIVKPHDDGCSVLVHKVTNDAELHEALSNIFTCKRFALVEELIKGMELTVGVVGNDEAYALPASRALASAGVLSIEEKFLPGAGENLTPAPLSLQAHHMVRDTMQKVYKALNCKGYARIDCFYQTAKDNELGKERIVIVEVNTLPGLTPATC
ncbi:MAG TPA: ATP-grasp domain-containing protein, partial [Candidatus Babeliaceae bacterium]|nr:ATP-grasp domain-containing protein [Candidatus Babeliaceae bacterium]